MMVKCANSISASYSLFHVILLLILEAAVTLQPGINKVHLIRISFVLFKRLKEDSGFVVAKDDSLMLISV